MRGMLRGVAVLVVVLGASPAFATTLTRNSSFTYDLSGLLNKEVVEPTSSTLEVDTDYTFDPFGNKATAKLSSPVSGAPAPRTTTMTYDSKGQFLTSQANTLSQTEHWTFDPRFGVPLSHTGPNGLTTSWAYDTFGRKIQEIRPDGNQTKWSYQYCSGIAGGTAICPANGAYLSVATPYAADGVTQDGATVTVYYDSLARVIRGSTQVFDGSVIQMDQVDTKYDSLGRTAQTSRPYFAGATKVWNTFAYDVLGRPLTETFPDSSTLTHAYHGLTTTDTNGLSQTRTVTKNSQGQVVSVTDAISGITSFTYDPFGNLKTATDPLSHVVTNSYDLSGHKLSTTDPDLGTWTYTYDVFGQLRTQIDAKSQTTTFSYDGLGRMKKRIENDMNALWIYDPANGLGQLAATCIVPSSTATTCATATFERSFTYNAAIPPGSSCDNVTIPCGPGLPSQVAITIGGTTSTFSATYNTNSLLATVTYPSGFVADYTYNQYGFGATLGGSQTFWTANTMDAELHLTQQTAGNGIVTNQTFDSLTGRLKTIVAGSAGVVQNLAYNYDVLGNLSSRQDYNEGFTESFTYDQLNRVITASIPSVASKNYHYDAIGNITSKSDVGSYSYGSPASSCGTGATAGPHAVTGISGTTTASFCYDANGNETAGETGKLLTFATYNQPTSIAQSTKSDSFTYDTDHQRLQQVAASSGTTVETTTYLAAFGVLTEYVTGAGGAYQQWNDYLMVGGTMVGVHFELASSGSGSACGIGLTTCNRYYHKDHLGSVAVLTKDDDSIAEHDSFDTWGLRRNPDGSDTTTPPASQTTRGYTGQEQLDDVGLVDFNGRVYDPLIGRFTAADPVVGQPQSSQGWNRYAYVGNNPLAFTDPNGFCFLGCFFQKFFSNPLNLVVIAVAVVAQQYELLPEIGALGLSSGAVTGIAAASAAEAIGVGIESGNIGAALEAGVFTAAEAGAFAGVGELTGDPTPEGDPGMYLANIAGHAAVGCSFAAAEGGGCGSGALSAGFAAAAGPIINSHFPHPQSNVDDLIGGTVASAVVGGVGSVLGGGKFENGAVTASFGYLFNQIAHSLSARDKSYLDKYYDPVDKLAGQYGVDPKLVLGVGIESGFASTGTYLRTGDAFGMTGGNTDNMTTAASPTADVQKFFDNYGAQINGTGSNASAFITALEGQNAAGAPVAGWKVYNSYNPPAWRAMIQSGIGQMQRDVPVYLQQRGGQ